MRDLFARWAASWPHWAQRLLGRLRIDFRPRPAPPLSRFALATMVAIVGSLVADAVLARLGISLFPAIAHYAHLRFSDYAKLTVPGVVVACAGWPLVLQVSSQPTWLYLRAAALVTLVLLTPDLAIWYLGQPADGVFVLVWMHLAVALVTFLSMITLAPVGRRRY